MNVSTKTSLCVLFCIFLCSSMCCASSTAAIYKTLASILNIKEKLENSLQNSHIQPITKKKHSPEEEKKAAMSTILFKLPSYDLRNSTEIQAPIVVKTSPKMLVVKDPQNQPSQNEDEDEEIDSTIKKKKRQHLIVCDKKKYDENGKVDCEEERSKKEDEDKKDKLSEELCNNDDKTTQVDS